MSVVSMADAALARRPDFRPAGRGPKTYTEIAGVVRNESMPTTAASSALDLVTTYIPTEVITLYLAFIGVIGTTISATGPGLWGTLVFLLATPIALWVVFAGKLRAKGCDLPIHPRTWPVWEMLAGMLAFLAWAFALPSNPFTALSWYSSALAGFLVLVVQSVIALLAPIFQTELAEK